MGVAGLLGSFRGGKFQGPLRLERRERRQQLWTGAKQSNRLVLDGPEPRSPGRSPSNRKSWLDLKLSLCLWAWPVSPASWRPLAESSGRGSACEGERSLPAAEGGWASPARPGQALSILTGQACAEENTGCLPRVGAKSGLAALRAGAGQGRAGPGRAGPGAGRLSPRGGACGPRPSGRGPGSPGGSRRR